MYLPLHVTALCVISPFLNTNAVPQILQTWSPFSLSCRSNKKPCRTALLALLNLGDLLRGFVSCMSLNRTCLIFSYGSSSSSSDISTSYTSSSSSIPPPFFTYMVFVRRRSAGLSFSSRMLFAYSFYAMGSGLGSAENLTTFAFFWGFLSFLKDDIGCVLTWTGFGSSCLTNLGFSLKVGFLDSLSGLWIYFSVFYSSFTGVCGSFYFWAVFGLSSFLETYGSFYLTTTFSVCFHLGAAYSGSFYFDEGFSASFCLSANFTDSFYSNTDFSGFFCFSADFFGYSYFTTGYSGSARTDSYFTTGYSGSARTYSSYGFS